MVLVVSMVPATTLTLPRAAQAAAPASPEELYDQGRKAYRLGDFQTAVDKWEEAWEATDNGLLLYNISLAYKGLYTITNDLADLRRARAILDNFIKVAKADPEIEEDDAAERLAELDQMIADAEQAERENQPPPPVVVAPEVDDAPREKLGPDPGRKLRLIGIGTMVGGGAIALTGGALAAVFGIRGGEFSSNLRRDNAAFIDSECEDENAGTTECQQLSNNIDTWRENGQQANLLTVALGAGLGGAGVVALVAGGLVFNEGNKRTKQWE